MGSDLKMVPIGELCDFLSGFAFKSEDLKGNSGIPVVKIKNVNNKVVTLEDMQFFPENKLDSKISRFLLSDGDVLIAMTGQGSVGRVGRLTKPNESKLLLNQRVGKFIPKKAVACLDYIYYVLSSEKYEKILFNAATGSGQPNLSPAVINAIYIPFIPLEEQIAVSRILSGIDKKILLNCQINQTLEQMAQTLFKSWFVDFDPAIDNALDAGFFEQDLAFSEELLRRVEVRKAVRESDNFKPLPEDIRQLFPDAFEECAEPALGVGGWMPKGWITTSLENVTSLIIDHRGKTPNKLGGEWSKKGYPAISAKNIKNGRLIRPDTIRYVDSKLYAKWMKDPLCAGDILMTSEAPVGELLYLVKDCEYLLSQRLYGIRANKEIISGSYLYFWLQTNIARADIDGRATGTTVVGIRQSELKQLKVMVPINAVVDVFSNLTDSYLKKAQSNEKQILELESLRDTLLPKLISGELSLSDVKIDNPEETLI
ncbi:restriction endonuclease subunit S [Providencia rettgeri]|nr:restriction endonuclease subunit S [Providencia rettgeri]